ncbi:MAG: dTDP-4-amino-4,6-dideoxygalactose transaminase [Anaerolineae bacterium]|nr:dTDP-4-amino-4,6-dideoxygalactose transaminase [Anaerolineae bacterium]
MKIPFNKPYLTGKELEYISEAHALRHLSGDGVFSKRCHRWLEEQSGCQKALLTHSCTTALEMAALLIDTQPGDEVIMPAFTFVSTANAFVLRGGIPVFVDIREDTLNIDETKIEEAITDKTRAIVVVHYAGVACEMDIIMAIANRYNLMVVEDNAQGIMATYKGRPLGSFGQFSALSFHETKNLNSGEGGALLINDPRFAERAEIIREKGTNRSRFFRGEVDKYTWVDIGSSYLPSELTAAFLWAQFEHAEEITHRRLALWHTYHTALEDLEAEEILRRPIISEEAGINGHIYYVLLPSIEERTRFIDYLKSRDIGAVFHYLPLQDSPAGRLYGRAHGALPVTCSTSDRLVRLPMWIGLEEVMDTVIGEIYNAVSHLRGR